MTTRTIFRKEEVAQLDYKIITDSEFSELSQSNKFLFVQNIEERTSISTQDTKQHIFNPIVAMLTFGRIKSAPTESFCVWKKSGVLKNDVSTLMQWGKVALIECDLSDAITIHSTYHLQNHECNFIFLRPPSGEEFENRLIRDVERKETRDSIKNKKV